jgi:hypothetical protein
MVVIRRLIAIASSFGVGACAIHPLPEDVTGVDTRQIVHRIRCEARDAVYAARTPKRLDALNEMVIVYSFSLQGTEIDGFTPSATFVAPVTSGAWAFNPSVGDTVTRANVRTFTIVDNYKTLAALSGSRKDHDHCATVPTGVNYQYPIVGRIGVGEMIKTFTDLALHTNVEADVQSQSDLDQNGALDSSMNGPPTMVDTISFTTMLTAGVTPSLSLTPVGSGAQLTGASFGLNFQRQDVHQVIVGLALPAQIVRSRYNGRPSAHGMQATTNQPRAPLLISAATSSGNSTEQAALQAVNDQIIRFQLPRPLIVTP